MSVPFVVLVVDDEPGVRAALRGALEGAGYSVLTAADGGEALRTLRSSQVSAVVLDLIMPIMNGLEMLEHKNSVPALAAIPVVALTAHAREVPRLPGVTAVLAKSPDVGQLLRELEKLGGS